MNTIAGHVVDVVARRIKKGILYIDGGKIVNFEASDAVPDQYIIPGFIDAHIHIESSMMLPSGNRKVFAGGRRPVPWNLRYSSTSWLTVCSIHPPDRSTLSAEVPYNKPGQPCTPCRWIERREARATDGRLGGKRGTNQGRATDDRGETGGCRRIPVEDEWTTGGAWWFKRVERRVPNGWTCCAI